MTRRASSPPCPCPCPHPGQPLTPSPALPNLAEPEPRTGGSPNSPRPLPKPTTPAGRCPHHLSMGHPLCAHPCVPPAQPSPSPPSPSPVPGAAGRAQVMPGGEKGQVQHLPLFSPRCSRGLAENGVGEKNGRERGRIGEWGKGRAGPTWVSSVPMRMRKQRVSSLLAGRILSQPRSRQLAYRSPPGELPAPSPSRAASSLLYSL